jgi:hypothetical protein
MTSPRPSPTWPDDGGRYITGTTITVDGGFAA